MILAKYGVALTFEIPMIKRGVVDFAVSADWTPATGDVKVSKDGGAAANITTLPTAITMGNTAMWQIALSATEMQAARIVITIADSATKAVEDQMVVVFSYGHASAHIEIDLDQPKLDANVTHFGGTAGTFSGGRPEVNTTHAAGTAWGSGAITAASIATAALTSAKFAAGAIDAAATSADFITEIRDAITGGAYALSTDANGRVRIVDGTGAGELDTSSGTVTAGTVSDKTGYRLSATGVDDIWDEAISGHLTAGSTGNALNSAGSAGDPWGTSLPGAYSAGTAGYILGTNLNTTVSSRSSHSAADVWSAVTRTLTGLGFTLAASDLASGIITAAKFAAGAIDAASTSVDFVTEIRAAITGGAYALDTDANGRVRVVDGTGAGEIDTTSGAVIAGSLGTTAKSDVNAEVVDALATDTYAEPGQGSPGATISLAAKINFLYKAWRNKKTQTSNLLSLFADDGTTVDQKSATSDDLTTTTFGEMVTGP